MLRKVSKRVPRRAVDKEEATRHLIHSSIRLIFSGEDPFAIHLMVQSAEKILQDLLSGAGFDDPLHPFKDQEFYNIYRELYNYLKHADRDRFDALGLHDIVSINDLILFYDIVRFQKLFLHITMHMKAFLAFFAACYPSIADTLLPPFDEITRIRDDIQILTRGEALRALNSSLAAHLSKEKDEDLMDVTEADGRQLGKDHFSG